MDSGSESWEPEQWTPPEWHPPNWTPLGDGSSSPWDQAVGKDSPPPPPAHSGEQSRTGLDASKEPAPAGPPNDPAGHFTSSDPSGAYSAEPFHTETSGGGRSYPGYRGPYGYGWSDYRRRQPRSTASSILGLIVGLVIVVIVTVARIAAPDSHSGSSGGAVQTPQEGVFGQPATVSLAAALGIDNNSYVPVTVTVTSLAEQGNTIRVGLTYCANESPINVGAANGNLRLMDIKNINLEPVFYSQGSTLWAPSLAPSSCQSGTSVFTTAGPPDNGPVSITLGPFLSSHSVEWITQSGNQSAPPPPPAPPSNPPS